MALLTEEDVDLSLLTDEELRELRRLILKVHGDPQGGFDRNPPSILN